MPLSQEPLRGYSRRIGGSAGSGTHGGRGIERPEDMPTKDDATHVVETKTGLIDAVQQDGAIVYVDDDIDVSGAHDIRLGDGITLVGGYCDPEIPGRGPVIRQKHYERHLFVSKWGEAPTLWGVSLRGPNTSFFDPRERVTSDEWDTDDASDWYSSGLWCYDENELEVYGCEFFGWTLAGLEIGSNGHKTPATIKRSSFHHCIMETLGYGIEHYNGDVWIDRCFFDACRHGFSGFGYPGEKVDITNCVIGPADDTEGWCGHALDMHKLEDNLHNGDWTAGGHFRIRNCTSMCTWDLNGYAQEGFAIRGTPDEVSWEDKNHWFQDEKPDAPGEQGDAYRQEVKDPSSGWQNFEPRDSIYGARDPAEVPEGYGAPRANQDDGTPTMTTLEINGQGNPANYKIFIDGSAEPGDDANKGDHVESDDEYNVIVGFVHKGKDTYELAEGTSITAIQSNGPIAVYRGGEKVNDMSLAAAGAWKLNNEGQGGENGEDEAISQLRKRVDALAEKINNARIAFGGSDK